MLHSAVKLPKWLDDYIFKQLGASYDVKGKEAEHNKDPDDKKVREYLGTYFPRSYGEVRCIAENLSQNDKYCKFLLRKYYKPLLTNHGVRKEKISILDLGCGTGGDIIGLLSVLQEKLPPPMQIDIWAFDVNFTALKYMKAVVDAFAVKYDRQINTHPIFYDVKPQLGFSQIADYVSSLQFDYILCCKSCSELLSDHVLIQPYLSVAKTFSTMLADCGIMLLLDVASQPDGCEYLPKEMNDELNSFISLNTEFCTLVPKPCSAHPECKSHCYMLKQFSVSHSGCPFPKDDSNVCYRIICRKQLRGQIDVSDQVHNKRYVIHQDNHFGRRCCQFFDEGTEVDAFDISS